jgi:hypothetical protein
MKLQEKQFEWLRKLYKCSELHMIALNKSEHHVLDAVLHEKAYTTSHQTILNKLRDRYPIPMLRTLLKDYNKSGWIKAQRPIGQVTRTITTGVHSPTPQYYVRKNRNGNTNPHGYVTGGNSSWYMEQWASRSKDLPDFFIPSYENSIHFDDFKSKKRKKI